MLRTFCRRSLLLLSLLATGCAMCPGPDDYTYSAFGGRWQRDDMVEGRVGSAFAPSGSIAVDDGWLPMEEAPPEAAPTEAIPSEAGPPETVHSEATTSETVPTEAKPAKPSQEDDGSVGRQEEHSVLR